LEKIVIRTDQSESAAHLRSLLNRLFPECEIQVVVNAEIPESRGEADGFEKKLQEEEHGEYFSD
jgi:hypothetical protein